MTRFANFRRKFQEDESGAIAIIFAVSIVTLVVTVGLAVDAGRSYSAASKLSAAADTAALAAAKLLDDDDATDSDVRLLASKVFQANIAQLGLSNAEISNFETDIDRDDSSVTITSDVSVPTTFGRLAGVSSIDFTPTTTVIYKAKKIELALVLDVTGSMNSDGKLAALKVAAKDLVDALFASAPTKGAVKVSMVPYAGSVNLGGAAAAASNGASIDNCVVERAGISAYTEDAPGAAAYYSVTDATESPKYSCPSDPVVPLTDLYESSDRNDFKSNIDALSGAGWTAGHIGTAWGWNTLSPNWNSVFSGENARDYDKEKVIKAIIVMTDGMFNTAYKNNGAAAEAAGMNESPTYLGSSPLQALQLCNAMRNPVNAEEEIQVYTVAFNAPATAVNLLQQCSGAARFVNAANASQLNAAFQKIVINLTSLRLSK